MDRRHFLHGSLVASLVAAFPECLKALPLPDLKKTTANPIQITDEVASLDFNGDDISRPHDILWDKKGYFARKGGIPKASETVPLVIVGGGISGLTSAYFLKDLKPIILEQAPQFGGNSKGEKIGTSTFSIGSAYLVKPDPDSDVDLFLKELGIDQEWREETSDEASVVFKNRLAQGFWQASTDPDARQDFERVQTAFVDILENSYPDIPWSEESQISWELYTKWDSQNFKQWLDENLGPIHPHIEEYLQLYAWSSFGGSLSEISAVQMLNFITAEMDSILALPGGNSAVAERLFQKLESELGTTSLRAGCFVIDISINENGVQVVYEKPDGQLHTVQAKACVFASPKFIADKVIDDLPKAQLEAMEWIQYRGYVVANVILNKKIKNPTFELYCLKGEVPPTPSAMKPGNRGYTDICLGSWSSEDSSDRGVLTIYKALPYDGARQFLFAPFAHDKNRKQVQTALPEALEALGLTTQDIAGVRLTRWGHSIPLARVGALTNGQAEAASNTFQNRVVFANQDNYLNPAFESAFSAAQHAQAEIREILSNIG
jgi:hypothetical protein